jgi:restriction system protein
MRELVPHLSFIENKQFWGTYLQGGVRSVTADDYAIITKGATSDLVRNISQQSELESPAEFALEQHLEEFIEANWLALFGGSLVLYQVEGQTGRQYPAGPPGTNWSIDFLAVDRDSSDLVVIELKRGKSSDSVVGQLLRYMAWVRENVASGEQGVRGMVIAKEVDDALSYAVKDQPISVKTYEVSFRLKD